MSGQIACFLLIMVKFRHIVVFILGLLVVFHYWPSSHVVPADRDEDIPPSLAVGGDITDDPKQVDEHLSLVWGRRGYVITPLAQYAGTVRVLGTHNYSSGREADLSPEDLVFGWGPMADTNVVAKVSISQDGRWYHWHVSDPPIPVRDIETHSANTHIIPANDAVAAELAKVETGDTIGFNGYLVEIEATEVGTGKARSLVTIPAMVPARCSG
jgi:hypothetical protein